MSQLVGTLSPLLLTVLADPTSMAHPVVHLQWLHVWLPTTGLLAMGLGNLLGGGDDEENGGGVEGDDDFLDGDEFDGGFDGDGDGFGDGLDEEDDDPLADIEPRISDLEAQMEDLSSTVSSINGEHESMRESVDDIEDNVRKLLEVYEVVTQGANPFADTAAEAPSGGGAFDLLGDDDDASDVDIDEGGSLFGDAEDEDDSPTDESATEPTVEETDSSGLSFDDLKSDFEFVGDEEDLEDELVPDDAELADLDPDGDDGEPADAPVDQPSSSDRQPPADEPYLADLPEGFGAELLVMEWLEFLVGESSMAGAMRALQYYRTVDWIGDDVARNLQSVLSGMTPTRDLAATDGGLPTELSVEHHSRSLEYVSRLRELGGSGHPIGSPDETLDGIRLGRRDHGVQR